MPHERPTSCLRLSASVCPTVKVPFSYCGRIRETVETLHDLGYAGVEPLLNEADDVDADVLDRITSKYEMGVPAIGTGLAAARGLSLSSPDERIRRRAVKNVLEFARLAERFDSWVILGSIKGTVTQACDIKLFERSIRELRDTASILEPLNRYESPFINTASEAIGLIRRNDLDRFGILLDTFHMNIEETSLSDTITRTGRLLSHVHIADSNRRAPGDGHIDFPRVFEAIQTIGYEGYVSAEILQEPTSKAVLRKTVRFVHKIASA